MSKKLIAVKQFASFAKDIIFERARKSLQQVGLKWEHFSKEGIVETSAGKIKYIMMDTVFFHPDRFEVLIDASGYRPEDIKCTITPNLVEVVGQRVENLNAGSRSMSLARAYQLPQPVKPEEGACCLSTEGLLLITAPWSK